MAATRGGITRSNTAGEGLQNSWVNVKPTDVSWYVAFDPTNGNKAIAEIRTGDNHLAIYSTDGGLTWTNATLDSGIFQLTGAYERIEMAYSHSNPNIVYALFTSGSGTIARSIDGGQNFTSRATQGNAIAPSWYNSTLWVSPTNPDFIVAGGSSLHKSVNGGDTFTQISAGYILTVQPHLDQHCIVSDPGYNGTTNKRVYVCNDGGVYRTDDITLANTVGNSNWEYISQTFQTSQYYGVAGNGTTGLIYGGTQDNGTLLLLPNSQNATLPAGGDGGFAAIDPTNDNYIYGSTPGLGIHRSTNRGVSVQDIHAGISDIDANFVAPFILDPNQPNRMLAGGRSLWRTNNVQASGQPTWTSIRAGGSSNISTIAIASGNSNIIWVGLNNGQVYKTSNGLDASPTWTPIDDNGTTNPLPNRMATRILIDKDDPSIVYVSFGGFENGNLQRTNNGGSTWSDITGLGLPDVPIRAIARHPNNFSKLYVGTEIGVFRSENGGGTWDAVVDGPANVSVDELVFMSNSTTLLAATHGRGLWTNDEEATPPRRTLFDFDYDGRADVSVFRPSNLNWYVNPWLAGSYNIQWGQATDKIVARDYDGDGKADVTVWQPSTNAYWHRLNSSNNTYAGLQLGQQGDVPVPADYDNDGKTDEAVFRPSNGTWYLNKSTEGFATIQWGQSGDFPLAADFDGDGKADIAVWRPSNGYWYCLNSNNSAYVPLQFGDPTDVPIPADYDGDGKTDEAVFRPSTGIWYLNQSTAGFSAVQWGLSTDIPVPADYDGDGKADRAVWRPTDGIWHLLQSANGYRSVQFGANGDVQIPAKP